MELNETFFAAILKSDGKTIAQHPEGHCIGEYKHVVQRDADFWHRGKYDIKKVKMVLETQS